MLNKNTAPSQVKPACLGLAHSIAGTDNKETIIAARTKRLTSVKNSFPQTKRAMK